MSKKKVGILTFHHVINEGAVLQSYSQAKTLKKVLGPEYEVEIIDYRTFVKEYSQIRGLIVNFIRRNEPITKLKYHLKIKRFINNELPLSKAKITTDKLNKAINFVKDKYDAIIVGADEIWKVLEGKFKREFPNIYWLPGELNCTKIASAASANRFNYKKANNNKIEYMKNCLEDFSLIGVRDDHTLNMLDYFDYDDEAYKVPDPTFSLELNETKYSKVENKLKSKGLDPSAPIMAFVTSSSGKKEICKNVRKIFVNRGYQIVSLSSLNKFADLYLEDLFDPLEWGHVFNFFDFCLTTKLHGTIFCLKNNTNFLTIDVEEKYLNLKSKTSDLLENLDLMNHHLNIYEEEDIEKTIKQLIQKENVNFKSATESMKKQYYNHLKRIENTLN